MYFVYIITNQRDTVLYIGVTNDINRRIYEHKNKLVEGFSKKYQLNKLVYFEAIEDIISAIAREKQLKNWHHAWKMNLIKLNNPSFKDLTKGWE